MEIATSVYIAAYFSAVNIISLFAFGLDKRSARLGRWRIPESRLLFLAFLGGSLGAKFGQMKFRHKTRKHPFRSQLNAIVIFQILALGFIFIPGVSEWSKEFVYEASSSANKSEPQAQMPTRFGPGSEY